MISTLRRRFNRTREYSVIATPPEAVVVYCSDSRFQEAFSEYISGEIGLNRRHCPIVFAGGAAPLIHAESFHADFASQASRIRLHCSHSQTLRRLVLIGHQDCKFFGGVAPEKLAFGQATVGDNQPLHDFLAVARMIKKGESCQLLNLVEELGLSTEFHFASFANASRTRITFQRVQC